jgi:outer membrane receptor protein involved in Fe transport
MNTAGRALLLLVLAGLARPASAQATRPFDLTSSTLEELMQVVVTTVSRTPEGIAAAPGRVQVVTAAQIERRGYRSLLDLLKDLVDFKVDLAADPDFPAQLGVQGTSGAGLVVLLIDGIRVSSPTNEPLPIMANYPVHTARQVEILYGPASALYGADAFSAVVNVITKDGEESPGLAVSSSVGQYGLYNQTASFGVRLGPRVNLMLAGQFLYDRQPDLSRFYPAAFGDLESLRTGVFNTVFGPMTSNRPVTPAYEIPLSDHSLHARLKAGGLDLSLFHSRSRASTAPPNTPNDAVYNAGAFAQNRLLVASGGYVRTLGAVTSTSTLMLSRHELDPESGFWNVFSNLQRSFKYAYGSMAKAEQQLSWKPRPSMLMTAGATYERMFAIPQGADLNAPVSSHDAPATILNTNVVDEFVKLRYSNLGAYAQVQYTPRPRVTMTLGARGDYNSRYGGTFNPRVGVVAQLAESRTLKVLFGTAFLAPSPYQAYSHFGAFTTSDGGQTFASSYWHLPNPDLEPQRKRTVEVNLLQALGRNLQFSGAVFYSRFSNLIQTYGPDGTVGGSYLGWPVDYIDYTVNEGHAVAYGATLGLEYLRTFGPDRRLEGHAAVALADGKRWLRDTPGEASVPTGTMAPLQLRFGADADWGAWRVAPRLSVVGAQRVLATAGAASSLERRTLPGYATLDVNVRRGLVKGLSAFLTLENALDRRYVNANPYAYTNLQELIGAPQNPRRLSVGLSLRAW